MLRIAPLLPTFHAAVPKVLRQAAAATSAKVATQALPGKRQATMVATRLTGLLNPRPAPGGGADRGRPRVASAIPVSAADPAIGQVPPAPAEAEPQGGRWKGLRRAFSAGGLTHR